MKAEHSVHIDVVTYGPQYPAVSSRQRSQRQRIGLGPQQQDGPQATGHSKPTPAILGGNKEVSKSVKFDRFRHRPSGSKIDQRILARTA